MKIQLITASIILALTPAAYAFTSATGAVTPSGLTITVTSADLITSTGKKINIFSGSYAAEFTRSGQAFAAVPLTSIKVPNGHYTGISVSYGSTYQAKLNGDKYRGTTAGGIAITTPLFTTTAGDGRVAGAVTTVAGTAAYVNNIGNNGSSGCGATCSSQSTFATTACVAPDASHCAGEQWIANPDVNLLIDTYQSIIVDANDKSLSKGPAYPYAMIGTPGAAIHLVSGDGTTTANNNVTLLYAQDGSLAFLATYANGSGATVPGPNGGTVPGVTLTSGGTNVSMVMTYDKTTGKIQFAQGGCPSSVCTSSGLGALDNVLQPVGSSVNYTCTADTTGALGFAYTGGNCTGSNPGVMKVARIVDPNGLLKIPGTTTSPCTTSTGVCAASPAQVAGTDTDGYL